MFKVLGKIEKRGPGGGEFLMRLGTGFENRDKSINFFLDAVPKNLEFQIRELDEAELQKIANRSVAATAPTKSSADALPF